MKKNKSYSFGIGTTSILMIFITVCLTVLCLLSYMVVQKDVRIIDKKCDYTKAYQNADNAAVDTLVKIDEVLAVIEKDKCKFNSDKTKDMLKKIDNIYVDYDDRIISYEKEVSKRSSICVELLININKNGNIKKSNRIKIILWQLKNKDESIEEETLNLWTKEDI